MIVKFCAISDFHGTLIENIEPCEVLLIAGDISPFSIQQNRVAMKEWMETTFAEWINNLPVDKVYLVPGNHDFYFQGIAKYKLADFLRAVNYKVIILENENASYICDDGTAISIFGTPYCHIFGNWAYMRQPDYLKEKFSQIPNKVDIIITHDAPYGVENQDVVLEKTAFRSNYEHIGNPELTERLSEIDYKWLIHGHIHSSEHTPEDFNGGKVVNVSILNETCKLIAYEPFYFEFDSE